MKNSKVWKRPKKCDVVFYLVGEHKCDRTRNHQGQHRANAHSLMERYTIRWGPHYPRKPSMYEQDRIREQNQTQS